MINDKYYQDVKEFPNQFAKGFESAKDLKLEGEFNKVLVCGMGGSSLFVELLNDYFAGFSKLRIDVSRGYEIPNWADEKTLFLVGSHSGNTEETIAALDEIKAKGYKFIALTSGGKLMDMATEAKAPVLVMPKGIQPRLTTGVFIAGILQILTNHKLIEDKSSELISIGEKMDGTLDENLAKKIAESMVQKVPVIYSTDNNSSIARISKIKFNENVKTQAFFNCFPELNHNEMVGFSNLVMQPFFLIYKSKFTNERNIKRIEVFEKLFTAKGISVEVVEMKGDSVIAEILNAYYFIDHVTLYLSEAYGVDPEPVAMVEDFKKML